MAKENAKLNQVSVTFERSVKPNAPPTSLATICLVISMIFPVTSFLVFSSYNVMAVSYTHLPDDADSQQLHAAQEVNGADHACPARSRKAHQLCDERDEDGDKADGAEMCIRDRSCAAFHSF